MLCATLPGIPVVALTATASKEDIMAIKESLNLKNPLDIIANPNRSNPACKGDDVDLYEELLKPMANDLKQSSIPLNYTVSAFDMVWVCL